MHHEFVSNAPQFTLVLGPGLKRILMRGSWKETPSLLQMFRYRCSKWVKALRIPFNLTFLIWGTW